jgi:hypothetical protein
LSFADDLTERLCPTRESENVGRCETSCEFSSFLETEELGAEVVGTAESFSFGSSWSITDEDELTGRSTRFRIAIFKSSKSFDEKSQVLLPRDSAYVEYNELGAIDRHEWRSRRVSVSGVGGRER